MFKSPEFWSSGTYRAKVKTPFEFVVSAVRASGAQVDDARQLVGTLNNMGMMPYGMMPPTGYSMKAETWVNSSALLGRMNFALGLTGGKIHGVSVDAAQMAHRCDRCATGAREIGRLAARGRRFAANARYDQQALADPKISQRRLDDPLRPPDIGAIAGLILGSPEFQKR